LIVRGPSQMSVVRSSKLTDLAKAGLDMVVDFRPFGACESPKNRGNQVVEGYFSAECFHRSATSRDCNPPTLLSAALVFS
jgi:hypothetical protein